MSLHPQRRRISPWVPKVACPQFLPGTVIHQQFSLLYNTCHFILSHLSSTQKQQLLKNVLFFRRSACVIQTSDDLLEKHITLYAIHPVSRGSALHCVKSAKKINKSLFGSIFCRWKQRVQWFYDNEHRRGERQRLWNPLVRMNFTHSCFATCLTYLL